MTPDNTIATPPQAPAPTDAPPPILLPPSSMAAVPPGLQSQRLARSRTAHKTAALGVSSTARGLQVPTTTRQPQTREVVASRTTEVPRLLDQASRSLAGGLAGGPDVRSTLLLSESAAWVTATVPPLPPLPRNHTPVSAGNAAAMASRALERAIELDDGTASRARLRRALVPLADLTRSTTAARDSAMLMAETRLPPGSPAVAPPQDVQLRAIHLAHVAIQRRKAARNDRARTHALDSIAKALAEAVRSTRDLAASPELCDEAGLPRTVQPSTIDSDGMRFGTPAATELLPSLLALATMSQKLLHTGRWLVPTEFDCGWRPWMPQGEEPRLVVMLRWAAILSEACSAELAESRQICGSSQSTAG